MSRLEDLTLFIRAAALSSFSDTVREVGAQPAQVSSAIKRLESTLAIRLFVRSTHSLRLTLEGEVWLSHARQMLDVIHTGLQKIQTPEDEVSDTLQIAVPSDLSRNLLPLVFQPFRRRYPVLRLRIFFFDQVVDVLKDPVNTASRYGNAEDVSYIALPIVAGNRHVPVALPEWVEQNGVPQELDDLTQFNAMTFVLRDRLYDRWTFTRDGEVSSVQVNDTIMSDDTKAIWRLTAAEGGVVYKSWLDVSKDAHDGRLQLLTPNYQGEKVPPSMICLHREWLSTAIHPLHEAVKARCEVLAQN